MAAGRTAVAAATDVVCHAVGRRRVVRAARFIHRRACLDGPNDIDTNGEIWLQHQVVGMSRPTERILVIDVGANVGRWSSAMLSAASQAGRLDDLDLHAFEPSAYTFARLSEALDSPCVTLARMALGDQPGRSTLHVIAPGAGTNSLYESSLAGAAISTEDVRTTTLDNYAERAGLDGEIALVKIDTEGHDLTVLRGARGLLAGQRITLLQFEYNQRWIYARTFLRDAFELLVPFGYSIGKLTWRGVEFYPRWDVDLESFIEANYVACAPWAAARIPSVRWWKTGQEREMR
jgi:FkbM family methyltransferase